MLRSFTQLLVLASTFCFLFHKLQRESATVGLKRLLRLIEASQLRPHIDVEAPWTEIGDLAQQLLDRRFPAEGCFTHFGLSNLLFFPKTLQDETLKFFTTVPKSYNIIITKNSCVAATGCN